ncbi:hypothetical protein [Pseudodesulfovibrio sp.]|uniref:hypothetical protein n=1 Tax=Pseudodesulfovibrio sp. TaxID=2035812 RepID=UPI002639864D|nr:hypothetical protein [Pseudodesulfovibrio sp.]MDD3311083.1 hypothetical protein [Pseudodesulfovibrio sp.]
MGALKKFLLSFVVFVVVCGLGLKWYVDYEVERELRRAVSEVDGLALQWDGLSVSILHPAVVLEGVAGVLPTGEHFTADRVRVTSFDQRNPIPHYAAAEAHGVRVDRTPGLYGWWPGLTAVLQGAENPCDLALDYAYDPAAKTLTIRNASLESGGLGRLELSGAISGIDFADHRPEHLLGVRIARADLRFTEDALVGSLLDKTAVALQSDVERVRGQVCDELAAMAAYADNNQNPEAADALRGLERFVRRPRVLTVAVRPTQPVPVPYIFMGRDLYDNIRLLNLSVAVEEKGENNQ